MIDWVEKLLSLQEKDNRIAKLREQVQSVPEEKQKATDTLNEAETGLSTAKTAVQNCEKAIKTVELDIETINTKRMDFEAKSTMIKDNSDYRAALHQIETCKNSVAEIEERELVLMEGLEAARRRYKEALKAEEALEKRIDQVMRDLDTRLQNCTAQLDKLQAQRQELLTDIPSDVARRYERMLNSRRANNPEAIAFAAVRNDTCMSCHMTVTPQTRTNASKGLVCTCSNCGVLLYFDS